MDQARFWELIDQARPMVDGDVLLRPSADPDVLVGLLAKLPLEEVEGFGRVFCETSTELNRWSVWAAGYVIAGGMGDDAFHYFRSWLIGKGQDVVNLALTDPDALGPSVDDPEVENEGLEYTFVDVLEDLGSEIDVRDEFSLDGPPTGEPFDEDTVDQQFPRLAARFLELITQPHQ